MDFEACESPLAGLGRKWVRVYTDWLHSTMAIRNQLRRSRPIGLSQDLMSEKLREVVETTDSLHALGCCPAGRLAGDEAALWRAALNYFAILSNHPLLPNMAFTDLETNFGLIRDAWIEFTSRLVETSDEELSDSAVLNPSFLTPEGLPHLFCKWTVRSTLHNSHEFLHEATKDAALLVSG